MSGKNVRRGATFPYADLRQWMTAAEQVGKLIADILIRHLDWPGAEEIADRLGKALPPEMREQKPGEPPPEPRMVMTNPAVRSSARMSPSRYSNRMSAAETAS